MAESANELRKLAAALDEAKRELNLARGQSTKPKHLFVRARRAVVQAARAVAAAVDLGFTEIWPQGRWVLSAMRRPDDPNRPPATIQVGEWKAKVRSLKFGSGCNADGTLRDDAAFAVWKQQICPVLRSRHSTAKADAGAFDFPTVKTDDQGRILGRDGKPLPVVEKTDRETGEPAGWYLHGQEARVTDDYDEADTLEHLRCQAADWIDACDVAAELIQKEVENATKPGEANWDARPFSGGEIVYFTDRVELCGVDICSGPRSCSRRVVLELLSRRRNDGSFVPYSGGDLEVEAKPHGAKGTAAGWIRDLRDHITEQLRNRKGIFCGRSDVILSGESGYRFADRLTVQFADAPPIKDITDITDTNGEANVPNDDVRSVFDVRDDAAGARHAWILQELAKERRLKAPDVAEQFGCSVKTAQRDLTALKDAGKIEFVGAPRTGFYRICQSPNAS
jgi:hypothetical protein